MADIRNHIFNDKKYKIVYVDLEHLQEDHCDEDTLLLGDCSSPDVRGRLIRICKDLSGKKLLELFIHEGAHGSRYSLNEAIVEQLGKDLAGFLWKLGYRRIK